MFQNLGIWIQCVGNTHNIGEVRFTDKLNTDVKISPLKTSLAEFGLMVDKTPDQRIKAHPRHLEFFMWKNPIWILEFMHMQNYRWNWSLHVWFLRSLKGNENHTFYETHFLTRASNTAALSDTAGVTGICTKCPLALVQWHDLGS